MTRILLLALLLTAAPGLQAAERYDAGNLVLNQGFSLDIMKRYLAHKHDGSACAHAILFPKEFSEALDKNPELDAVVLSYPEIALEERFNHSAITSAVIRRWIAKGILSNMGRYGSDNLATLKSHFRDRPDILEEFNAFERDMANTSAPPPAGATRATSLAPRPVTPHSDSSFFETPPPAPPPAEATRASSPPPHPVHYYSAMSPAEALQPFSAADGRDAHSSGWIDDVPAVRAMGVFAPFDIPVEYSVPGDSRDFLISVFETAIDSKKDNRLAQLFLHRGPWSTAPIADRQQVVGLWQNEILPTVESIVGSQAPKISTGLKATLGCLWSADDSSVAGRECTAIGIDMAFTGGPFDIRDTGPTEEEWKVVPGLFEGVVRDIVTDVEGRLVRGEADMDPSQEVIERLRGRLDLRMTPGTPDYVIAHGRALFVGAAVTVMKRFEKPLDQAALEQIGSHVGMEGYAVRAEYNRMASNFGQRINDAGVIEHLQ